MRVSLATAQRAVRICWVLTAICVAALVWVRLHNRPLRYWLGAVAVVTTPVGGINVVAWNVRARGTELTFDFAGTTINVKFWMTSGNVRVLADIVTPRESLRFLPVSRTVGGIMGPWGTQRMTMVYVPLWWLPLVPAGVAWRFRAIARRLVTARICSRCNYDLAGLSPAATCPECGCTLTAPSHPAATPSPLPHA